MSDNYEKLKEATKSIREEYVKVYLDNMKQEIEDDKLYFKQFDMDFKKLPRTEYQSPLYMQHIRIWNLYGFDNNLNIIEDKTEIRLEDAKKTANEIVDSFLRKMYSKIRYDIEYVESNGKIWDGAVIRVKFSEGHNIGQIKTWKTKAILNRSKLGKWFTQWPTRLVKS